MHEIDELNWSLRVVVVRTTYYHLPSKLGVVFTNTMANSLQILKWYIFWSNKIYIVFIAHHWCYVWMEVITIVVAITIGLKVKVKFN